MKKHKKWVRCNEYAIRTATRDSGRADNSELRRPSLGKGKTSSLTFDGTGRGSACGDLPGDPPRKPPTERRKTIMLNERLAD